MVSSLRSLMQLEFVDKGGSQFRTGIIETKCSDEFHRACVPQGRPGKAVGRYVV